VTPPYRKPGSLTSTNVRQKKPALSVVVTGTYRHLQALVASPASANLVLSCSFKYLLPSQIDVETINVRELASNDTSDMWLIGFVSSGAMHAVHLIL
jgi:hypothetical protein